MKDIVGWLALVAALGSAGLGGFAASLSVRDNQDKFIQDLQRQSRWAAWAAAMAGVSVLAQTFEKFLR